MRIVLLTAVTSVLAFSQTVPFVGCASHGQLGPEEAPKGRAPDVRITALQAQRLAYYSAEPAGYGVLAPRGWDCVRLYGSDGGTLYLSAEPIDKSAKFEFAGPAIVLTGINGGGSGITRVAQIIARVFPAHKAYVRAVINSDLLPASEFPFGPWPGDKLRYKSSEIVEYETPGGAEGLGTWWGLRKDADRIRGVAMLVGKTPDLVLLSVRLPAEAADLAPIIIQQVERERANH